MTWSDPETLRRAAALLDKYALDASDSGTPWRARFCTIYGGDGEIIAETQDDRAPGIWEAEWIALMHPGIAPPLAAWLREIADAVDQYEGIAGYGDFATQAFDIADILMGET